MRGNLTLDQMLARYAEKPRKISIRGYLIRARPEVSGWWSNGMVFEASLGANSAPSPASFRSTSTCQCSWGRKRNLRKCGNDPASGCRARVPARWSFPPLGNKARPKQDHNLISSGSQADQVWIQLGNRTGIVKQKTMSKFKIEKGLRTITAGVDWNRSLMSEGSNNDKNYVVNELLRFVLSQHSELSPGISLTVDLVQKGARGSVFNLQVTNRIGEQDPGCNRASRWGLACSGRICLVVSFHDWGCSSEFYISAASGSAFRRVDRCSWHYPEMARPDSGLRSA